MKKVDKNYFIPLIKDKQIAREVIESPGMNEKTRSIFKVLLESNDKEDWNLLVDRLAGWLVLNQPEYYD